MKFDAAYELALHAIAGNAIAGAAALSSLSESVSPPNRETLRNEMEMVSMAVPKERPKSFSDFREDYLVPIYYTKIPGLPMLSSPNEALAGPRYDLILAKLIAAHESGGRYTTGGANRFVAHDGKNYVERVPDPSGGDTIGDGISLRDGGLFEDAVRKHLAKGVAYDAAWNPILSPNNILNRIQYLRADVAQKVSADIMKASRERSSHALELHGVDYGELDAYAKLALDDLCYNLGSVKKYVRMMDALSGEVPDYVRAAYEICDSKDWDSLPGLRTRRIHDAHLMLMAAERNGGLDIYFRKIADRNEPQTSPAGFVEPADAAMVWYQVRPGDTLYSIARRHNSTVDEIAADNGLNPLAVLPTGQSLKIRNPVTRAKVAEKKPSRPTMLSKWHVVEPGETFSGVAFSNGVRLNALKRLNPGMDYDRIQPGQRIRIS